LRLPAHHTGSGYICHPHRQPLPGILDDITRLYPLLELEVGTGAGDARVTGSREAPLPLSVDVLDLTAPARVGALTPTGRQLARHGDQNGYLSVATILDSWVRDWRTTRDRGERLPDPEVTVLATWLRVRLDWAAESHPAVADFVTDIRALRGALTTLTGSRPPKPRRLDAPCSGCGQLSLWPAPGEDYAAQCRNPACRRVYTPVEYDRLTRLELAYATRTDTP
jgi:hypothetical protein